ncbi:MAG: hypothetical protein HYZ00_08505 [Candidatus Hydrogenedentes bacterium]|nr:hypothetical protein [Candidatus Hydrogenedentota bacterium]
MLETAVRYNQIVEALSIMSLYTARVVVEENGKLVLDNLPFSAGEMVNIDIETFQAKEYVSGGHRGIDHPLRNMPYVYIDPFEPAAPPEEWDALTQDE